MANPVIPPSRETLFEHIANASLFGNLGFFIGAGFSMALTEPLPTHLKAPNFKTLLDRLNTNLNAQYPLNSADNLFARSCPQLASEILQRHIANNGKNDATDSQTSFKSQVAAIANLHPDESLVQKYRPLLRHEEPAGLAPSWFITTNYDFIIETIVDSAQPLLPTQALTPRTDRPPVFHLHGHRLQPDSIVVTEEDYAELFGPLEYRQTKLSTLLSESTTIMLGYALGDMNIKAALKLASAFKGKRAPAASTSDQHNGLVVQVYFVHDRKPAPNPYEGKNGETIIETDDILKFLLEASTIKRRVVTEFRTSEKEVAEAISSGAAVLERNSEARRVFVKYLQNHKHSYRASHIVTLFKELLEPLWKKATQYGGWQFYNDFLNFVLDIFSTIDIQTIQPAITNYFCEQLIMVLRQVAPKGQHKTGYAHDASTTWHKRRDEITPHAKQELLGMLRQRQDAWVLSLFE